MTPDHELRAILRAAFPDATLQRTESLSGGISARAAVASLTDSEGRLFRVVVRRPERESVACALEVVRAEQNVLQWVSNNGILAPTVRCLHVESAALILDYVEGQPDFAPVSLDDSLRQMARQLAQLHDLEPNGALDALPRHAEQLRQALSSPPAELDDTLGEARLRELLLAHFPWDEGSSPSLLHGDYWPGNLLWQGGRLRAILDWEEACLGDRLVDVAIARLDLTWAFGAEAAESFTRYYLEHARRREFEMRSLALWELAIALRPMSKLARWAEVYPAPPISRPDITYVSMRSDHAAFVARAIARLG